MSLTLLPAVDVRDGKAVRLRQGESGSETDYGSPLEAARTWVESGAQWIHLVDLDAAFGTGDNRDQLSAIVRELGDKVNIEMSGGVRDDASLDAALEAGAAVERAVDVQSQELGAIRRGAIGQGEVLVEHLEAVGHRQECAHCD